MKVLVVKLKRRQLGQKSGKPDSQIAQFELCLEDLEAAPAAAVARAASSAPKGEAASDKPARRRLPESLPRVTKTHAPKHETCPACGGKLRSIGKDVSEMLECVPGHFEVIRLIRPKLSCAICERIVQELCLETRSDGFNRNRRVRRPPADIGPRDTHQSRAGARI